MNIVREHINEKFVEDSDPIHDMHIGLYHERTFETPEEAANFIIKVLPGILETEEIPKDIIYGHGYALAFNIKYFTIIQQYIDFYINSKTTSKGNVLSSLYTKLHELGYPKH